MERWIRLDLDEADRADCKHEDCSRRAVWHVVTSAGSAKTCDDHAEDFASTFYKLAEIAAGVA